MSRSLVGSSSTSTLAGRLNRRASSKRLRSPPEQRFDRRAGALRREQKIAEIADDVLLLPADFDKIRAWADGVGQRRLSSFSCSRNWSKYATEILVPRLTCPLSGCSSPRMSLSSVVLPAPFGPSRPILSPRRMRQEKSSMILRSPNDLQTFSSSATSLPERSPGVHSHLNLAELLAARRTVAAQLLERSTRPSLRYAARLDALAYPYFFLRQHLVELGVHYRLVAQHSFLDCLIGGKIAGETRQLAAIQFDDARGDVIEKTPVVGDEQHRTDKIVQQPFQPFDGGEIQMVGRLVEEQHIRLGHQCLRQRHALRCPPDSSPTRLSASDPVLQW